jgi:chaperonin GroEL (HSP60 family)
MKQLSNSDESRFLDSMPIITDTIQESTSIATKKDILRFVNEATEHNITRLIIEEAFISIGITGKVFVENSKSDQTTIEIKDAYSFDVETFNDFFFDKSIWSHSLVSIIVIDGIIESVSEINNILENASKNVEPVIIVARGFGDDVLQTLYVNMQRKTLNVFPVKLLNDETSINSFVDISVVSKTDPVSYLKGNLISSISYDDISVVEKAEVRNGKLVLINRVASGAVYRHLERLRKDVDRKKEGLDAMSTETLNNIVTGRMKSLSGRSIELTLSKNITSKDTHELKVEIDSAFRTIPTARDFGMVDMSQLLKTLKLNKALVGDVTTSSLEKFFGKFKKVPAGSLIRCIEACNNNANLLNRTSGALLYEKSKK